MRLIVAANRAPFIVKRKKDGIKLEKSPGGLVSALDLIMRKTQGLWVCTGNLGIISKKKNELFIFSQSSFSKF